MLLLFFSEKKAYLALGMIIFCNFANWKILYEIMSEVKDKYENPLFDSFCLRGCKLTKGDDGKVTIVGCGGCAKMDATEWLNDTPISPIQKKFDIIEVRFKNSRKDFYKITDNTEYAAGDVVVVEAQSGYDIGVVSLTGETARLQVKKKNIKPDNYDMKKVYRRAKQGDIDKWAEVMDNEFDAIVKSRKICSKLGLDMKLNDIEYQGDGTKAYFYYTAEDRVDFRDLIRILADQFKVRIEMKQIGTRQESGKIGGIGICGREVCCGTWLSDFNTVSTNTARLQQLSLNPQKLAGQCGKLKCCLNYENSVYADALKDFPSSSVPLKSKKGRAFFKKADIFKMIGWYSYENSYSLMALPLENIKKVIALNVKGVLPETIEEFTSGEITNAGFEDIGNQADLKQFKNME